jgi:hypothetical protein
MDSGSGDGDHRRDLCASDTIPIGECSHVPITGATMFRLLAASWLTNRLVRPLSRVIPNPFLRAAAIAGAGIFASRLLKVGPGGGRAPRR